jgi:plasmid stabilization system protein ParE
MLRSRWRGTPAGSDPPEEDVAVEEGLMPQAAWSNKRERQYEHIKEGLLDRGRSEKKAEEIAARTVNKERARHGEAKQASRTSVQDISSGRRGGLRSHSGAGGRTKAQLYNEARRKGIEGRSKMSKAELERAVG